MPALLHSVFVPKGCNVTILLPLSHLSSNSLLFLNPGHSPGHDFHHCFWMRFSFIQHLIRFFDLIPILFNYFEGFIFDLFKVVQISNDVYMKAISSINIFDKGWNTDLGQVGQIVLVCQSNQFIRDVVSVNLVVMVRLTDFGFLVLGT